MKFHYGLGQNSFLDIRNIKFTGKNNNQFFLCTLKCLLDSPGTINKLIQCSFDSLQYITMPLLEIIISFLSSIVQIIKINIDLVFDFVKLDFIYLIFQLSQVFLYTNQVEQSFSILPINHQWNLVNWFNVFTKNYLKSSFYFTLNFICQVFTFSCILVYQKYYILSLLMIWF